MPEVLYAIELEELQIRCIADDVQVRQPFRVQMGVLQGIHATQYVAVVLAELGQAGGAEVVPESIEP